MAISYNVDVPSIADQKKWSSEQDQQRSNVKLDLGGDGQVAQSYLGKQGSSPSSGALRDAISSRLGRDISKQNTGAELQGFQDRQNLLDEDVQFNRQIGKIFAHVKAKRAAAAAAKAKARNGVLSSVLGLAGAAGGFALAGPAGAGVGAQVGGSVASK